MISSGNRRPSGRLLYFREDLTPPYRKSTRVKKFLALASCLLLSGIAVAQVTHVNELGELAARLRHLSYSPVPCQIVSQSECSAYLLKLLDKELEPRRTHVRENFLKHLGLLPRSSSMKKVLADLYSDQVRGLYDPAQKRYLVVKGGTSSPAEAQMGTMAAGLGLSIEDVLTVHELDHAIQDQHFHLDSISSAVADDFDRELAADSLIEGDATVLMMDYAMGKVGVDPSVLGAGAMEGLDTSAMMTGQGGAVGRAPHYFQQLIGFPYSGGMKFVAALKARGGWPAVDRAWRQLPESSEQILHPEKYGVDHPKPVTMPPPIVGMEELGSDTAGEWTMQVWASENGLPRDSARGWGGDRYQVFESGGATAVLWATTWDTEGAAMRFEQVARTAVAKGRRPSGTPGRYRSSSGLLSRVQREGSSVNLWLDAPTL
jgi:hypothetical protein